MRSIVYCDIPCPISDPTSPLYRTYKWCKKIYSRLILGAKGKTFPIGLGSSAASWRCWHPNESHAMVKWWKIKGIRFTSIYTFMHELMFSFRLKSKWMEFICVPTCGICKTSIASVNVIRNAIRFISRRVFSFRFASATPSPSPPPWRPLFSCSTKIWFYFSVTLLCCVAYSWLDSLIRNTNSKSNLNKPKFQNILAATATHIRRWFTVPLQTS